MVLVHLSLALITVLGLVFVTLPHRLYRLVRRQGSERAAAHSTPRLPLQDDDSRALQTVESEEVSPTKPGIETYFQNGEWKNKVAGSSRAANKHATKAAAVKVGREMARKRRVDHTVKDRDGTVRERASYAGDEPPRASA